MPDPRLRHFIETVTAVVNKGGDEADILAGVSKATTHLVSSDAWLPADVAVPHPDHFQQYLLYCDPRERFSIVSFVWGPGQGTPVHDHTVWGVIGMLRGAELCEPFKREGGAIVPAGKPARLEPGQIEAVSPLLGDIHRVSNAYDDRVSVSIHTYGANIGRVKRHVFDLETGEVKDFISGYANA